MYYYRLQNKLRFKKNYVHPVPLLANRLLSAVTGMQRHDGKDRTLDNARMYEWGAKEKGDG
jgi:hypothetical protein